MKLTRRAMSCGAIASLVLAGAPARAAARRPFEAWRRDFEAGIEERMADAHVAGLAVAITGLDQPLRYAAAFGFADLEQKRRLTARTPMHLATISKLVTATALVQLFERLRVDLDSDVTGLVGFPVQNPSHPGVPITPRQLLTHTFTISDAGQGRPSSPGDPTEDLRQGVVVLMNIERTVKTDVIRYGVADELLAAATLA